MRIVVLLAWLAYLALLLLSLPLLPARLGNPGHDLPKLAYVAVMLASATLPLLLMGESLLRWIGHHAPGLISMPNKAYWMAPQRREASLTRLNAHMQWMRLWLCLVMAGVHLDVLWRTHPAWPQPPAWMAGLALSVLLLSVVLWAVRAQKLFSRAAKP